MGKAVGGSWYALVADDDDDWRRLVASSLRRAGYKVSEARDGDELMHCYTALSAPMKERLVVVTDIAMPGCDGVAATQWVRNASKDVPIVWVTGERSERVLGAAHAAGATLVLSKPVACAALVTAVASLTSRKAAAE